jgi:hypothetical protein
MTKKKTGKPRVVYLTPATSLRALAGELGRARDTADASALVA